MLKSHCGKQYSKYLSPLLSIAEMHRLYLNEYEHGTDKPSVSYSFCAEVFNSMFNLGFGQPHADTCATCKKLKNKLALPHVSSIEAIMKKQKEHLCTAGQFYNGLHLKTSLAKEDSSVLMLTFDFQQNYHFPISQWVICFTFCSYGCTYLASVIAATIKLQFIVVQKLWQKGEATKLYLLLTSFPV